MEGFLPIFFLGIVLKVPIFAALYLIYWAVRAEPERDEAADDGDHGFRRWRSRSHAPSRAAPRPARARRAAAFGLPARRQAARAAPAGAHPLEVSRVDG